MGKKYLGITSLIILFTILFVYIQLDFNTTKTSKPEELTAEEKITQLNDKVARGEEIVLDSSAIFPFLELNQLFDQSDIIVSGKIVDIEKEYMEYVDIPFTDFQFEVDKFFYSDNISLNDSSLVITQDGNTDIEFEEHDLLEVGKKYILFLERAHNDEGEEKLILVGGPSGVFYNDDSGIAIPRVDFFDLKDNTVEVLMSNLSK
ncbi:hypothetical protein [Oceanobacillus kimchii]|uniref:hypothetical protein n=1 Tax=Oceanobacillus kimchii TaxID=746691 RepID=UPI003C787876